jgi:hypothetical protein
MAIKVEDRLIIGTNELKSSDASTHIKSLPPSHCNIAKELPKCFNSTLL